MVGTPKSVELHFHALPGVDDGPVTLGDSVELVRHAAAQGTETVVATPHVRTDFVTDVLGLGERVEELRAALRAEGVPIELRRGAELGHDMVGRLSQHELESIAQGPPSARWLLVESPFEAIDEEFHAATDELRDRGFGVLVAHPERSADAPLCGSAGLRRELWAGSLAQVNAQSITGAHGADAQCAALALIGQGLITVVSSDAHGASRPPLLREAGAHLVEHGVEPLLCRSLIGGAPRRLLARGIPRAAALVA
jgi:protein-tyrosine phosphatase